MKLSPLLIVFLSLTFGSCSDTKVQPNVILILADDLGAGDLGCTGHPYVKSPNIDRLANEGTVFSRGYMASGWCSPSRYGLMTGVYPARNFDRTLNMKPEELTITKLLNDNGYATAHFGKWHMNRGDKVVQNPSQFGIDEFFIHNGPGEAWTKEDRESPHWREKTTDFYVNKTIDFISGRKNEPFYVNLWLYPTHSYINPTEEMLKAYEGLTVDVNDFENPQQREFLNFVSQHGDINKSMQSYCADVTAMDKAIGRLLEYLDEAGISDNTLIVFSSDNGPGPLTQQVKNKSTLIQRYSEEPTLLNSVGSSGEFRERKSSVHDGGTHVPWIVRWPNRVKANHVDNETIIHGTDWLPTIAAMLEIEVDQPIDGSNMNSAYIGDPVTREAPVFWKLRNNSAVLKGNLKGVMKNRNFQLFDVNVDPGETNDISQQRPQESENLKSELDKWEGALPELPKNQKIHAW